MSELESFGLSEAEANKTISEIHMQEISRSHCSQWRMLYSHLELDQIVVSDMEHRGTSEEERRLAFFNAWKGRKGSDATYGRLIYALLKIMCRQDAEFVKQLCINT